MKVLYLHQYFVTPDESGASRSYWFATKLIERGHQVTVITALSSSSKRKPGKYLIDGINVIYVRNSYSNVMTRSQKIFSFSKFILDVLLVYRNEKKADIVYATSTPLTVGVAALIMNKISSQKYIFEVRDLWPEFPIQIKAIKNRFLIYILKWLEKKIYKNAEKIVALSPGMKNGIIKRGIEDEKVSVIPNMSKPDIFYPRIKSTKIMNEYKIDPEKYNVIHFGSMGKANGLEYIIETAKILQERKNNDIVFILAGYGATEQNLKLSVKDNNLENILFIGKHNTFIISEIVNCCDASLISFLNVPVLTTNSPNKLFDSLSAGKPIIVNSVGWTKELIEEYNCGYYVNPDSPNDFASKLVMYKNQNKLLEQWSLNARKLAVNKFNKELLCKEFTKIIENF